MPRRKIDFDVVRKIGLALPEVEESTHYRGPSLKIRGRLLTCPAIHKSEEPNSLLIRISIEDRDRLIASQPDVYYLTDHYLNYPALLVRLDRIKRAALEELLQRAWRYVMEQL